MNAIELLKRHEGFRSEPYLDTVGVWTVGYGRNLKADPFTAAEAETWLSESYQRHWNELAASKPIINTFDAVRKAAIGNMAYNLGIPKLLKFKSMWAALESGDYSAAARHAIDSHWASQVGKRAREVAHMIRTGEWP